MLAYQQKESTARVASIMETTNLSKQQQGSEIMRQMLTQPQTAGQYFTNDQIKEMTRKVSAEVDLVHQQTQIFFFNDSPTTEIYTLSLHDALPISRQMGICSLPNPEPARSSFFATTTMTAFPTRAIPMPRD